MILGRYPKDFITYCCGVSHLNSAIKEMPLSPKTLTQSALPILYLSCAEFLFSKTRNG